MQPDLLPTLARIAAALERLAPPPPPRPTLDGADAFVWHPGPVPTLQPVPTVARVALELLHGIDAQKALLVENTRRFAAGRPANNAMLWGARGMGKSSLVKAAHAAAGHGLALIEIHREDIRTLPDLLGHLRGQPPAPPRDGPTGSPPGEPRRALVFCDDLSFEREDADYKALKSVLDGGIEGRPSHVLFYATSNRRHLMPRDMIENERATAINPSEAVEEKVSLSDRFGLWIGFHNCDQPTYFAMVEAYAAALDLPTDPETLRREAASWSIGRGARSGRVAWQFIQDFSGRLAP